MQISRTEKSASTAAPEASFTGDVRISGYFRRAAPSRLAGAFVSFPAGARTPWKINPFGQTVIVTSGLGWAQCEGEGIVEIRSGDVIWFRPGERHWEGATSETEMSYFAIQEEHNRRGVEFGPSVTDQEYQRQSLPVDHREPVGDKRGLQLRGVGHEIAGK